MTTQSQQIDQLIKSLNSYTQAQSRAAQDAINQRERSSRIQRELDAETEEHIQTIVKGRKLNAQQLELQEKLRKAKKAELDLLEDIRKATKVREAAIKTHGASSDEAHRAQKTLANVQNKHAKQQVVVQKDSVALSASFRGLIKGVNLVAFLFTFLAGSIKNTIDLQRDLLAANAGLAEGMDYTTGIFDQQGKVWLKGFDQIKFAEIMTANRQVVNAMGGLAKSTDVVDKTFIDFYAMTGDREKSLKLSMEALTSFAQKGVKPTSKAMQDYMKDVTTLAGQTGMGVEAAGQFYNSIHDDIDSITLLRAAREGEREAIIKSQRAMVQQAIAAGMSAEQAKEAAKMLNKMVAAKPIDRIKQAAKIRAMGGALGIAGADKAADAVMAGKRATASQKQDLMSFSQNATNTLDQSAQGGLGAEIFATTLSDKLNLEQYFGANSPFSTTLGDKLAKSIDSVNATYAKASESSIATGLNLLDKTTEQVKQVANGTIIWGGILTGVLSIDKFLKGMDASNWISNAFSSAMPQFSEVFSTTLGVLVDTIVGAVNGIQSMMARIVATVFKLIPGAGIISDLIMKLSNEKGKTATDAAKRVGMTVVPNKMFADTTATAKPGLTPEQQYAQTGKMPARPESPYSIPSLPDSKVPDDSKRSAADIAALKAVATTADATKDTATSFQTQLKKMDDSAVMMKKLVENSEKSIELAEKQLVAMTMTETERTQSARSDLRTNNKFGSTYGYL